MRVNRLVILDASSLSLIFPYDSISIFLSVRRIVVRLDELLAVL